MAHGKTLEMIKFSTMMGWRRAKPREHPTPGRDRTLRGKARRRAARERRAVARRAS